MKLYEEKRNNLLLPSERGAAFIQEEFNNKFNAIIAEEKAGQKYVAEKIAAGRDRILEEQKVLKKHVTEEIERIRLLAQGGLRKNLTQQVSNPGSSIDMDNNIFKIADK